MNEVGRYYSTFAPNSFLFEKRLFATLDIFIVLEGHGSDENGTRPVLRGLLSGPTLAVRRKLGTPKAERRTKNPKTRRLISLTYRDLTNNNNTF